MSVGETPGEPGAVDGDGGRLTNLLEGFEDWLRRQPLVDQPTPGDGPDLNMLLREFIALRQEINLLTRAARTQQEQNVSTLDELASSVAVLRASLESKAAPEPSEAGQLNLKQLVEVRDNLARAERETIRSRDTLDQALTEAVAADPESVPLPEPPAVSRVPWFARLFGVRGPDRDAWVAYAVEFEQRLAEERQRREITQTARLAVLTRVRQIVTSLLDGYTMSVQRVDRLLQAHDLEPIAAVGQRFDPERMEALESVLSSGRPAGEVVEEVRRGYLQRSRVFRFALVRVARDG